MGTSFESLPSTCPWLYQTIKTITPSDIQLGRLTLIRYLEFFTIKHALAVRVLIHPHCCVHESQLIDYFERSTSSHTFMSAECHILIYTAKCQTVQASLIQWQHQKKYSNGCLKILLSTSLILAKLLAKKANFNCIKQK